MNCTIETVSQPVMTKPVELELTGCAVGPAPCQLPRLASARNSGCSQGLSAKASLERPNLTNGQILQRELRTRGLMLGESSSTIVNVCVRSFGLSACRVITLRPAMYVADSYRAPNPEAAVEIIAANPWAVLVSCTDEAPLASSTFEAAQPERPTFKTEACDYWA